MFELLLQADMAVAEGHFERAERTYWQLIELDPRNAIALAGLARFSLERGDKPLARALANRALGIDPESIVARRVLDTLDRPGEAGSEGGSKDLTLVAAEQLEALGRRRRRTPEPEPPDDVPSLPLAAIELPAGEPSIKAVILAEAARDPVEEKTSPARNARSRTPSAGATQPGRVVTVEEGRENKRRGRIAAAAAAAGEAARERQEQKGDREPERPAPPKARARTTPIDPFAAAEMAAAIAAVDEIDEMDLEAAASVEAMPPDAAIAEPVEAEPAAAEEPTAEEPVAEEAVAEPAADAEAEASAEAGSTAAVESLKARLAESAFDVEAAEAEAEAMRLLSFERDAVAAEALADREDAEEERVRREGLAAAATPDAEPEATQAQSAEAGDRDAARALSEEEAEAAALREAFAIMMSGDAAKPVPQSPRLKSKDLDPQQVQDPQAAEGQPDNPPSVSADQPTGTPQTETDGPPDESSSTGQESGSEEAEQPRKKGLLGRFRG